MIDIFNLTRKELEVNLLEGGFPQVHAKKIFRIMYSNIDKHQNSKILELPKRLQEKWQDTFRMTSLNKESENHSAYDHSIKFVFSLDDGSKIETVLMPESNRLTLCLSSQVGCRQACVFCHTGRMGLKRNLSCSEVIAQITFVNRWLELNPQWLKERNFENSKRISNIVFMGMGEPLDNTEAVIQAIKIMLDPFGLQIAPKRIVVSTAGHLDGLKKLVNAELGVSIALSLHAADSKERSRLLPINRRYPLADILEYLKEYCLKYSKDFMAQYTVIEGVNDKIEHAEKLIETLKGLPVKVNLIPLNPISKSRLEAPSQRQLLVLQKKLLDGGLRTMVRYSKGQDITAACGQLIT